MCNCDCLTLTSLPFFSLRHSDSKHGGPRRNARGSHADVSQEKRSHRRRRPRLRGRRKGFHATDQRPYETSDPGTDVATRTAGQGGRGPQTSALGNRRGRPGAATGARKVPAGSISRQLGQSRSRRDLGLRVEELRGGGNVQDIDSVQDTALL